MTLREWYIRYHEVRQKLEALKTILRPKCAEIARKQANDESNQNKTS